MTMYETINDKKKKWIFIIMKFWLKISQFIFMHTVTNKLNRSVIIYFILFSAIVVLSLLYLYS